MRAMSGIESQDPQRLGYIHGVISDKINVDNSSYRKLVNSLSSCTNENVDCVTNRFMKYPSHSVASRDFMELFSLANRCEKTCNIDAANANEHSFLQAMSFLNSCKNRFSPADLAVYNKSIDQLHNRLSTAGGKKKSLSEINEKLDSSLWQNTASLFAKYGSDISKNLTAFMLNQSVDAWCKYHRISDREQALKNIDKVFNDDIAYISTVIDYCTERFVNYSKFVSSDFSGTNLRQSFDSLMSAIRTIPSALKGMKKDVAVPLSVSENSNIPDIVGNQSPEPMTPNSPTHVTFHGGNAYATINDRPASSVGSPITSEPWSAVTEKLLASDKLTSEQRNLLLEKLIISMGGRHDIASHSPHCSPLLSGLNGISNQELPTSPPPFHDHKFTHVTLAADRDDQRLPDSGLSNDVTLPPNATVMQSLTKKADASQTGESQQIRADQVIRQLSTDRSVGSDMSPLSSPRSSLNNFSIGTLSPKLNINPLGSLAAYHQPGADLSVVASRNGRVANDDFHMAEASSRSDSVISVEGAASGINTTDLVLLKRVLRNEVKGDENEIAKIDTLILREEGPYIQTLDYLLYTAFLAEPGTQQYSDMQQAYINRAFSGLQLSEDFSKLSLGAQMLVEKYSEKRNFRVLTTTPGVRRSLSSQVSRG